MRNTLLFLSAVALAPSAAHALNTSSVFSPEVDAGSRSAEYRGSFIPVDEDDEFAHRFHYQQAWNDTWRWRLISLHTDRGAGDLEFRYGRLEIQQQIVESDKNGWDSAFRYELQIAEGDDLPHQTRFVWTNKWTYESGWEFRAIALTGVEFGAERADGLLLETRAQVTRKLAQKWKVGVEMYNDMNTTEDFGSFDEQDHQIGPIVKWSVSRAWRVESSLLLGASDAAADHEYRVHVIRSL